MFRYIAVLCFCVAGVQTSFGQDTTVANAPPVVVKTTPQSGAIDVDPATKEIVVVFSKEMKDGSWSWSTAGKNNYPESDGKPTYRADKKSCVLPVKLEPGKDYAIWLNSAKFGNFKDAHGKSAVPYLLVFRTK
ncbi:Ig-like domain-containing protein [bacterium]|nr:Ig-like domain-containing protein [bacterium]